MSRSAYTRFACKVCGKQISTSGGGVNHYRKHVREGYMKEVRKGKYPNTWFEYEVTPEGHAFIDSRSRQIQHPIEMLEGS